MAEIVVPNLPGYKDNGFESNNYAKSHCFDVVDGLPVIDRKRDFILKPSLLGTIPCGREFYGERKDKGIKKKAMPRTINALPRWVAYDRQVLRFWGYSNESVHFSNEESSRVRVFTIYYYLQDDTVHINEKKQENSGCPQGLFLKRRRVPCESDDRFIEWNDLLVGEKINIFGLDITLCACDKNTRDFYTRRSQPQPENSKLPCDELLQRRKDREIAILEGPKNKDVTNYVEAQNGRAQAWQLLKERQFLSHDTHVLRFWCVWNDTQVYGRRHNYILNYYLADDTIAIYEEYPANAGTTAFPTFLKRCKLPRKLPETGVALIGNDHSDVVDCFTQKDLRVGGFIEVYGRNMLLLRCDSFTKDYYQKMHGCKDEEFVPIQEETDEFVTPKIEPAPHNGFGTEADSLGSVTHLIPRPPRKNFTKLTKYDKTILRFSAEFNNAKNVDVDRRFVIEYFRADDTLKIFETRTRNSGFVGGKFLERCLLNNVATGDFFKPEEFFVGAIISINGFTFNILEADESTVRHMEDESDVFPFSNKSVVRNQLRTKISQDKFDF